MTAASLITDLKRRGCEFTVHGDRLRWRAPEGVMTAEMLTTLRRHKSEVLAALNAKIAQRWGDAAEAPAQPDLRQTA